jgi:hypothetical protein
MMSVSYASSLLPPMRKVIGIDDVPDVEKDCVRLIGATFRLASQLLLLFLI